MSQSSGFLSFAVKSTVACLAGLLVAVLGVPHAGAQSAKPSGEPIRIGVLFSTTGTLGQLGSESLPGAQILVDEVNAAGGINGRPVVLVHADDESRPEQAVPLTKRLIQRDRVVAIAGPLSTSISAGMSPIVNESRVPAVGCICGVGALTPFEFSIMPLLGLLHEQAQFAKANKVSKVGVITQAGALAELIKATQVPLLEKEGISVVGFEQFQPGDTDVTALLARLRAQGAQQIYAAATGTPAALIAKNFKQVSFPGHYWTFGGNASRQFISLVGDASDVVNMSGYKILVYKQLPGSDPMKARLTAFAKKYIAKTGREPGYHATFGYDTLLSIAEGLRKSGPDRERLRDALETQSGVQTLNGPINRSAKDHNGVAPEWVSLRIDRKQNDFVLVK